MADNKERYFQVHNIIKRSHALILNVKLLGADTTEAKKLLDTARSALEDGDYDNAIVFSKKSMVEVMELKKQIKSGQPPKALGIAKEGAKEEAAKPVMAKKVPKSLKPDAELAPEAVVASASPPDLEVETSGAKASKKPEAESPEYYEDGYSYLIEENRANFCFKIFPEICVNNKKGLCICRVNPAIIRRKYNFDDSLTMLWLTDRESSKEPTISPSLESMIYVVEEFIDKNDEAVILLDGMEYLISNNSFNPVLRFIRRLIDKISETSTILLIGVSPKAINEQELKLLERELNPVVIN